MIDLSLWDQHDLPVLRAIAELEQVGSYPYMAHHIGEKAGLDHEATHRALARLLTGGLIEARDLSDFDCNYRLIDPVLGLTESGRRQAGAWPSAEDIVAKIIRDLTDAADLDPAQSTLRSAAKVLAGTGRDIAVGAAGSILAGYMPPSF